MEKLKQDLPTFRKLNAHIVLATQSPSSVLQSEISAQFLDNCATNIFFCNPRANFEKHYQHFNISQNEFKFIKETLPSKRLFLYKQNQMSAIARLNLSSLKDALWVYSANRQTVALCEEVRALAGEQPEHWLPMFYQRCQEMEA